ncbi:MAG: Maf family nucleotide pyrophosphatase [Bacteroidota bacterium]|nr:Maf family nucleotide pyrophosphatase [Bacteroidota bacterium]
MFFDNLKKYNKIILASQSPRRQNLFKELGIEFEIKVKDGIEEIYNDDLKEEEIALYLAKLKSIPYVDEIENGNLVITADTIVLLKGKVIGKPEDAADAKHIVGRLSGNMHRVITGVCLSEKEKQICFHAYTDVYFKKLSKEEIDFYIDNYKPFDKAGAYGIQEWIGYIGIEKIEGSYFNVMGLPIQRLYEELRLL